MSVSGVCAGEERREGGCKDDCMSVVDLAAVLNMCSLHMLYFVMVAGNLRR